MSKIFLFVFLTVTLVAFVACGSDSGGRDVGADVPTATPAGTPTTAEQAYLDEVEGAAMLIVQNFDHFGEVINSVYPTRGALFGALTEAGAGTAFDDGLAAMEALDPPERFREEHELALDGLRDFQRVDRQVGQSVADNDLVAFALANVKLAALAVENPLQHSQAFCLARFILTPHLCERPDFSSSGEYGEEIYSIFSRIQTDVVSVLAGQLPALNDEEVLEVLDAVAPSALEALEQSEQDVDALDPPEGFEADHERLVRYLGDLLVVVTEQRQAAERGDFDAAQAQLPQLLEVFCAAANDLSSTISPFVVVHFGDPSPCGGG